MTRSRSAKFYLLICIPLFIASVLFFPHHALAKSFSITKVDIQAQVDRDGIIHVVEDRTFDFSGDYNGVFWLIPEGIQKNKSTHVDVVDAGYIDRSGQFTSFKQVDHGSAGQRHVFSVEDSTNGSVQVKKIQLFNPVDGDEVTYRVDYKLAGAVEAGSDVAELYWKFVSDGWSQYSENVTCTIYLPAAQGANVDKGTIRAWAHGPLNGRVEIFTNQDSAGAIYEVPEVGSEEFAEARMCFPVSWVPGAPSTNEAKLDDIIEQETAWANEANAKREAARSKLLIAGFSLFALATLFFIISLKIRGDYKKSHTPRFKDLYFRDVPTTDHPAVLQGLLNNGFPDMNGFSASVMRLCDLSVLKMVESTSETGILFKKTHKTYELTGFMTTDLDAMVDKLEVVDLKTFELLFEIAAEQGDPNRLVLDDIESFAKIHPETYHDIIDDWKACVYTEGSLLDYYEDENPPKTGWMMVVGLFALMTAIFTFVLGASNIEYVVQGENGLLPLVILCGAALVLANITLAICIRYKKYAQHLSREAIEIKARLLGLKKWICEFTNLDEAIPEDVVLWNRIMVMAVALGVADKAIENLKMVAPQILEDPGFCWYYTSYYPYSFMSHVSETAYSHATAKITESELASSVKSSGSGFGGGFSGGGGGGVGGGGGGGAF